MTEQIQDFTTKLQNEAASDPFFSDRISDTQLPTYEVDKGGRKYIRIVMISHGQSSVWGFIEKASGGIFKAAGWAKPA